MVRNLEAVVEEGWLEDVTETVVWNLQGTQPNINESLRIDSFVLKRWAWKRTSVTLFLEYNH